MGKLIKAIKLESGPVIVNFAPAQADRLRDAIKRNILNAIIWAGFAMQPGVADRVLLIHAAGNDADKLPGKLYAGLRSARFGSPFAIAATLDEFEMYRTIGVISPNRKKPILANRTAPEIEARIVEFSLQQPAFGQIRVANEMRKLGHSISPAGVCGVWQHHDLETMKKRLKALEAKVAQEGLILTEAQLVALEKAKS
jgi:hypothetical protein